MAHKREAANALCTLVEREKKSFQVATKTVKLKNVSDLEYSLVTRSRPSGQPQKKPDDRTLNAGVETRAADDSRRTHGPLYYHPQGSMADCRCCQRAMSEVLIQQFVISK